MRTVHLTIVTRIFLIAAVGFCASECKDIQRPPLITALVSPGAGRIGVVSTDFGSAGRFSALTPDGISLPGYAAIHSDAVARVQNNRVYIINRLNRDNIQVLDPAFAYATVQEFSTGSGSNPQDIVVLNETKAYVSLFNRTTIAVMNPTTGQQTGTISLASFADADGFPEMSGMHLEGDYLYVALERLDRNQTYLPPALSSLLVEINVLSDSITNAYTFQRRNPFGHLRRVVFQGQPHIIAACPGRMGFISAVDGGVEAFNLVTRTIRPGFLYTEEAAGGDILDAVIKDDSTGYALVLDASFNKYLQRFDPVTGTRQAVLAAYPAFAGTVAGLLLAPNGFLYVGDTSFSSPGVRIYDSNRSDLPVVPFPVNVGLRPFDLVYIPAP